MAREARKNYRRKTAVKLLLNCFENCKCPHCQGDLGKEQIHMIVSSPLFQQSAEKLQSI